jgi:selenocysteine-specific elongation factor
LETLAQGTPAEILLQALDAGGVLPPDDLFKRASLSRDVGLPIVQQLLESGDVLKLGEQLLVSRGVWSALGTRIGSELRAYHTSYPLRLGMPREELKSKLGYPPKPFSEIVKSAAEKNLLVETGPVVRAPEFKVTFSPEQQRAVDLLLARFRKEPFAPPSVKDSEATVGADVLAALVDAGTLTKLSEDVLFLTGTFEQMAGRIKAYIQQNGKITLGQTRDLFNTSRKYAQALLEYLDAKGITRRVGDERVLR